MPYSYGDSAGITPASLLILRIEAKKPNFGANVGRLLFIAENIHQMVKLFIKNGVT